ncbi:MDR family NADP-dependent oxidoreductase [Novosphingobium pentaromativorans]|uniref:Enoyl reductase (ER) domain-containing protein n=1 Tax=Novosphingobium pentaromativorans US6-1 TaxID=1088721 RepID=G6EAU7_9SPHN|nr:NADP-dependent oxidoreductase [Novosphingobium pentaromativorans]AIT80565.1 hypothetical protein JI59_12690 [Novosphingobium pentaromativorans US6-1]EHJ61734.1 hypothetical protein NSU_1495 [Novosphingobium pentaromativorans US6-1]
MRKVVLAKRPNIDPRPDDFEIVDAGMPEPKDGQLLVKVLWQSIDPYVRLTFDDPTIAGAPGMALGEMPLGRAVSQVVTSRHPDFAAGDIIEGRTHWGEYAVVDPAVRPTKLDFGEIPLSYAVGALGMPGQTAYAGVDKVLNVQAGQTMLVSAAAGAVGTLAGQIAKHRGARVVGIAGGPDKCAEVEKLGFDACVDYKAADFSDRLAAALPGGFNAYFENVGGDMSRIAFQNASYGAKVALCGVLSVYAVGNETGPDRLPEVMRLLFTKGLTIQSFFGELLGGADATVAMRKLIEAGAITPRESIIEGIENLPAAFSGIFRGNDHVGKVVLHIADPD